MAKKHLEADQVSVEITDPIEYLRQVARNEGLTLDDVDWDEIEGDPLWLAGVKFILYLAVVGLWAGFAIKGLQDFIHEEIPVVIIGAPIEKKLEINPTSLAEGKTYDRITENFEFNNESYEFTYQGRYFSLRKTTEDEYLFEFEFDFPIEAAKYDADLAAIFIFFENKSTFAVLGMQSFIEETTPQPQA